MASWYDASPMVEFALSCMCLHMHDQKQRKKLFGELMLMSSWWPVSVRRRVSLDLDLRLIWPESRPWDLLLSCILTNCTPLQYLILLFLHMIQYLLKESPVNFLIAKVSFIQFLIFPTNIFRFSKKIWVHVLLNVSYFHQTHNISMFIFYLLLLIIL